MADATKLKPDEVGGGWEFRDGTVPRWVLRTPDKPELRVIAKLDSDGDANVELDVNLDIELDFHLTREEMRGLRKILDALDAGDAVPIGAKGVPAFREVGVPWESLKDERKIRRARRVVTRAEDEGELEALDDTYDFIEPNCAAIQVSFMEAGLEISMEQAQAMWRGFSRENYCSWKGMRGDEDFPDMLRWQYKVVSE